MIRIVTDSTCDLADDIVKSYGIDVVPLYVQFGAKSYKEGIDLPLEDFYRKVKKADVHPKTSQPTAADFLNIYTKYAAAGDSVISVHLSGKLSGTVNSARAAAEILKEDFEDADVTVIDSLSASSGLGIMVIKAAEAVQKGSSKEEVIKIIEELKLKTRIIFSVADLNYLHRGGRIGKAAAFFGSILSVTPLLHVVNGEILAKNKTLGMKNAIDSMVEYLKSESENNPPEYITTISGTLEDDRAILKEKINEAFPEVRQYHAKIGEVIGTHIGIAATGIIWH